jgi:sulfide:quinone oxidoreductase
MTTSVLVLGAGFGGLELSARLSEQLGDAADVTLIDRGSAFVFGFSKLDVMFGRKAPDEVRLPYRDYACPGVRFRNETVTVIDPVARRVTTDAAAYEADILVIALGAAYDVAATPGLAELGHEFYSVGGAERVRDILPAFQGGDVIVGVCGTPFKCPPAPNECALLLDQHLRDRGTRQGTTIRVVVPMHVPLPPSPELSTAILDRYAARDIEYVPDRRVTALESPGTGGADPREAVLDDGTRLAFDLFLGIPVHRAPQVVVDAGLTDGGWIPVERGSAATRFPGVYAVGDVTSVGTPKAGVFAERAARVVADQLIARIRGEQEPPGYDGTGACWVELGNREVGGVEVDFFSTPGQPRGWFTRPSDRTVAAKADFAATRHDRWFGLRS